MEVQNITFTPAALRKIREDRKLLQKEVAEAIGATKQELSNWENGYSRPPATMLLRLLVFYRISAKRLSTIGQKILDHQSKDD